MAQFGEPGDMGEMSPAQREEHQELQRLASSYLAKKRTGQKPTRAERNAFHKLDELETQRRGEDWISRLPKKSYCAYSGRSRQTLLDHAKTYGIPCGETSVDAREVIRWLHDFLVKHKNRLPVLLDSQYLVDDDLLDLRDKSLQKQIAVMDRKIQLLDMDIADRASEMLPRTVVHEILVHLAQLIRSKTEVLGRQFGNEAVRLVNELGADVEKYVEARLGNPDGDSSEQSDTPA